MVQGFVRIVQQTVPAGDPQPFAFTANGSAAPTPAGFSLTSGGEQLVEIPLSPTGGTQTLRIDQAAVPGWRPDASIACTSPTGGPAPWVTVDETNRRLTAVLDTTNHGAVCTITNTKTPPNVLVVKSADPASARPGDVITYTLVVQNAGPGDATGVVVADRLSPHVAWATDGFGPGAPFQLVDGAPPSGLAMGAATWSADGGATFTFVPESGGGGAPPGFDARVTNFSVPMTGSFVPGGQFTLSYKVVVR